MWFAAPRTGFFALCLTAWFCAGPSAPAQGCDEAYGFYECIKDESTYKIITPEAIDPNYRFPVVVVLHDAGGNGTQIIDDDRLIESFVENGFAVLAPDALARRDLRFIYDGDKHEAQSQVQGTYSRSPVSRPHRNFVMVDDKGRVRDLRYRKDTGWYFYNIDLAIYKGLRTETEYLGRDEIRFLRNSLEDAAEEFGIDPEPVLIVGLGHGGSLVWQIACHAPTLGRVLAPVGGAYWRSLPRNCRSGSNLIHTHSRNSLFWPLGGAKRKKKRFARTGIGQNLEMLLAANRCQTYNKPERNDEFSMSHTVWDDCAAGGPVEYILLDEAFAFQDWWLAEMLARVERTGIKQPFEEIPEVPVETGPKFKKSGAGTGFQKPGAGTRFKAPGTKADSRFKPAK